MSKMGVVHNQSHSTAPTGVLKVRRRSPARKGSTANFPKARQGADHLARDMRKRHSNNSDVRYYMDKVLDTLREDIIQLCTHMPVNMWEKDVEWLETPPPETMRWKRGATSGTGSGGFLMKRQEMKIKLHKKPAESPVRTRRRARPRTVPNKESTQGAPPELGRTGEGSALPALGDSTNVIPTPPHTRPTASPLESCTKARPGTSPLVNRAAGQSHRAYEKTAAVARVENLAEELLLENELCALKDGRGEGALDAARRLTVYDEVFTAVIDAMPMFAHVLGDIKHVYDTAVTRHMSLVMSHDALKCKLAALETDREAKLRSSQLHREVLALREENEELRRLVQTLTSERDKLAEQSRGGSEDDENGRHYNERNEALRKHVEQYQRLYTEERDDKRTNYVPKSVHALLEERLQLLTAELSEAQGQVRHLTAHVQKSEESTRQLEQDLRREKAAHESVKKLVGTPGNVGAEGMGEMDLMASDASSLRSGFAQFWVPSMRRGDSKTM